MKFFVWLQKLFARPAPRQDDTPQNRARALATLLQLSLQKRGGYKSLVKSQTAFVVPKAAPGVVPSGINVLANDAALGSLYSFAAGYAGAGGVSGIGFLGYPFLAELAQRAEFRKMSETIAREMTRKWIKLNAAGDEDKTDKISKIEARFKQLGIQALFRRMAECDGFYGVGHLYIDTGASDDAAELATPLFIDKSKIRKGSLRAFRAVEPIWTYPNRYNSNDPLLPDFLRPTTWYVQGKEVHNSRLLTFISREAPDLLKPAYAFGGISLTQLALEYVDNWLRTRQSVSDLIHSFSIMQLATDLSTALNGGAGAELDLRAQVFNNYRDNQSLMLVDKEREELSNVSAPLGSLDHLQAQAQEQQASVSSIPLVKLLGITPSGLNASSDGEIRSFYDTVHSLQELLFSANLDTVLEIVQLDLFGAIDPDISYKFVPLWQLDDAGLAAVRKIDAETDAVLIDAGAISPLESRKRIAASEGSLYNGLDVNDLPDPPNKMDLENGDPSENIGKAGAEGAETGANSGV